MRPQLIGLVGRKRAGKDTVAAHLKAEHHYRRIAFADRLKAAAYKASPLIASVDEISGGATTRRSIHLREIVDETGWEKAKEHPEVRRFLQNLGVAMRDTLDRDVWVAPVIAEALACEANGLPVVVTDVRFTNEIDAIRKAGGVIVRVDRPGLPDDGDTHVSEHEWRSTEPDFVLVNHEGQLEDLNRQVNLLIRDGRV